MSLELYGWGTNSHGQLGLGYQSEQAIYPEKIDLSHIDISPDNIKCIIGGAGHTLILYCSGQLYGCGWNKNGQVGISSECDIISTIQPINCLNTVKIIDIACGWDSSFAITDNGDIYGWGSNYYGQLGIKLIDNTFKNNMNKYYRPIKILINVKVKCIAMGLRHSACVSDNGDVFVTGSGNKCQLGLVDINNKIIPFVDTFTQVNGLENIVDVSCGQYFTIALDNNGNIFTWGNNKYGQLGIDCNEIVSNILPIKLKYNFGIIKTISCGWTHVNVLNNDGIIYSWGRDTYGELGNYIDDIYPKWQPKIVQLNTKIRELCVGSEHNIALNDVGKIYSWGWNEHGNCGNGNIENIYQPCEIFNCHNNNNNNGLLIGCGAAHSFVIIKKNI